MDLRSFIAEALTLGIACLGAALGIFNTWHAWRRDKVRLRLEAAFVPGRTPRDAFRVTVRNLSAFPVTVEALQLFQLGGVGLDIGVRGLPVTVEARAPLALLAVIRAKNFDPARLRLVASTACGTRARCRVK